MFSNLRQGNLIYILEKGDNHALHIGQVVKTGNLQPKYNAQNPALSMGLNAEMVIDVIVKTETKEFDLRELHGNLSIEERPDINAVVSDNREAMLQEVDALERTSRQRLEMKDYDEATISRCQEYKRKLNPNYDKELRRDEAINDLTERFNGYDERLNNISDTLGDIKKLLSKAGK